MKYFLKKRGKLFVKKTKDEKKFKEVEEVKNKGQLIVDATCTPADIRYPTDISILNEARMNVYSGEFGQ